MGEHRLQEPIDYMLGLGIGEIAITDMLRQMGHDAVVIDGKVVTRTESKKVPTSNSIAEIKKAVEKSLSPEFEIEAGYYNPMADGARGMRDIMLRLLAQAERGELEREK